MFLTAWSHTIQPTFTIFNIQLHYYGLIMASAIFLAIYISSKRAHLYHLKPSDIDNLSLWLLIPGILGARIYHVIDEWSYYAQHPQEIIAIWNGGIGIYGAILGGLLGIYLFSKKNSYTFTNILNLIAPQVLIAQAIGRWGNFFNQEAFGNPTDNFFKIYIQPQYRPEQFADQYYFQPLFLYESIWNLLSALILLFIARKMNHKGPIYAFYFILYGLGRLWVETYRFDTATVFGLKTAHIFSTLSILFGIILLVHRHLRSNLIKSHKP